VSARSRAAPWWGARRPRPVSYRQPAVDVDTVNFVAVPPGMLRQFALIHLHRQWAERTLQSFLQEHHQWV
jgi:hypothetical protein